MNVEISAAIKESINHDTAAHVSVEIGDLYTDIYDALAGVDYEEAIEAEPGVWDVWGSDDYGNEWRIYIHTNVEEGRA